MQPAGGAVAERAAERALSKRYSTYVDEVRKLIEAGRRVMQRTGSIEPRVSEIVRESELSNQAFYRHFKSKDELLFAILEDGLQQLEGFLRSRMALEPEPLDKVRRWVRCVLAQALDPTAAAATRVFVASGFRLADHFPEETQAVTDRIKRPLRDALAEAVERGHRPVHSISRCADRATPPFCIRRSRRNADW